MREEEREGRESYDRGEEVDKVKGRREEKGREKGIGVEVEGCGREGCCA